MSKFRFKTSEEFKGENLWFNDSSIPEGGYPSGWNADGKMNSFLGQDVPEDKISLCDESKDFIYNDWWFTKNSYKLQQATTAVATTTGGLTNRECLIPTDPYFDIERVKKDLTEFLAGNVELSKEQQEKVCEDALNFLVGESEEIKKRVDKFKESVEAVYSEMKDRLLEEVTRGRVVVNLTDTRQIRIQDTDHPKLLDVVKSLNTHHKAMLVGPAGTGKSYMVAELAKRLELPFYKYSCSRDSSVHDLLGYKQPRSETYLETAFLKAYEYGGVFLVDEFDAMSGDMSLFFNGVADSSKFIAIPHRDDKPIAEKHKDFYLVMCGNTWGKGSIEFSGRDFQDAALMDRFRFCRHYIGYHTTLEKSLMGNGYSKAMQLRTTLESFGSYLSTRNIEDISLLLNSGFKWKDIAEILSYDLEESEKNTLKRAFANG